MTQNHQNDQNSQNELAHLTADVVAIAEHEDQRYVLLIQRAEDCDAEPGKLALPGGHLDAGERAEDAARRELAEETGMTAPEALTEIGAYHDPGRDPRGRYVTVAYLARLDHLPTLTAGDDASAAHWYQLGDVLAGPGQLAFDHAAILAAAVDQLGHGSSR